VNGRSDLANAIGNEEAQLLAAVYGAGQRLFVPSSTAHAEHLEVILGLTATSALVHAYGGNYVYLPGLSPPTGHARGPTLAQVKALSKKPEPGMSAAQIARKFRVSVRCIYAKRRELKRRERLGLPLGESDFRRWMTKSRERERNGRFVQNQAQKRDRAKKPLSNGNGSIVRLSRRRSALQEFGEQ
jgi:hypothetical protein